MNEFISVEVNELDSDQLFENIKLDGLDSDQLIEVFADAIQTEATIYFLDNGKISLNSQGAENILYFDGNTIIYSIDTLQHKHKINKEYTTYDLAYELIYSLKKWFYEKINTIISENKDTFIVIDDNLHLRDNKDNFTSDALLSTKNIKNATIQEVADSLTKLIKVI